MRVPLEVLVTCLFALRTFVILNPLECGLMVATVKVFVNFVADALGRCAGAFAKISVHLFAFCVLDNLSGLAQVATIDGAFRTDHQVRI